MGATFFEDSEYRVLIFRGKKLGQIQGKFLNAYWKYFFFMEFFRG